MIAYNTNARYNTEIADLQYAKRELIQAYQFFDFTVDEFREYVRDFNSYGEGI